MSSKKVQKVMGTSLQLKDFVDLRNANGEVYTSDVHRWLNESISVQKAHEIAKKLTELKENVKD